MTIETFYNKQKCQCTKFIHIKEIEYWENVGTKEFYLLKIVRKFIGKRHIYFI